MSDLLERMEEAWLRLSQGSFERVEFGIAANVCQEAMDEIRSARVEIERLTAAKRRALQVADERAKELNEQQAEYDQAEAHIEDLNRRVDELLTARDDLLKLSHLEAEANKRLREQLVKAREALEDLLSDADRQMKNPSHHIPFSYQKAKDTLAALSDDLGDEK